MTKIISELGINHNGSVKLAKRIIDLAKKYNFNAVKFQKRNPDVSVPNHLKSKMRESPWGYISYLEYKKKIEFGYKEFQIIDRYCKKKGIYWFASAWDLESVDFLKRFKCKFNKIASAMLTNLTLLEKVAKERKLTFISTGMAKENDIKNAIKIFKKHKCKFTLLYCVSSYPAEEKDLNLLSIPYLKNKYNCEVGYSGHESTVSPSIMAYMLGAKVIERHITLDRAMWGTDHSASLSEPGIKSLTETIRKIPKILGKNKFLKTKKEFDLLNKFKYWN